MSRSVVGLDLDPFQARAAEVRIDRRGGIALERVARLDLPPGAVGGGLVTDPELLGAALAGWWSTERFSTRSVIVGLASPDLRVAVVEEPLMTSEELDTTLRATAPATLGVSTADHLVDYQVIERVSLDGGGALLRVLLVAAPRTTVDPLLAALARAGLRPELIDLHAFALLRALAGSGTVDDTAAAGDVDVVEDEGDGADGDGDEAVADPGGGGAGAPRREALVGVGGGGAVVVVHDDGAPRRIAVVGPELERGTDAAPAPSDGWLDATTEAIADVIRPGGDDALTRLRVAGAPAVVGGLLPRLGTRLGMPVEAADPIGAAAIATRAGDVGDRPSTCVALGLALAGRDVAAGAHRLDLLPPADSGPSTRRHAVLAGAAVLATVVGLGALWLGRAGEADRTEDDADRLEQELADLGAVVTDLSSVNQLAVAVDERAALVGEVLEGDVAWTKLLQEIATVQPDDVWLRSFVARAPGGGADPGFTVSGRGTDHTSAARWLIRLQGLPTVEDVWVPRSQRAADEALDRFGEIEFDSSGELTDDALSNRVELYVPPDPAVLGQGSGPGDATVSTTPATAPAGTDPTGGPVFGDQDEAGDS